MHQVTEALHPPLPFSDPRNKSGNEFSTCGRDSFEVEPTMSNKLVTCHCDVIWHNLPWHSLHFVLSDVGVCACLRLCCCSLVGFF